MNISQNEIADALTKKGAMLPCHRCGSNQFSILEGFSNIFLQNDFNQGLVIGGPSIPIIHVACNNCGAITDHAIGALGFLSSDEQGAKHD